MLTKSKWLPDLQSGFLVFLIALPLCIGISLASGYPATAGLLTAIVGGLIVPFLSNSELTIKGPAAGLIVIALGCVTDLGFTGGKDLAMDFQAYRAALAVGVASAALQIVFSFIGFASLVDFFPLAVVHGMLAAIGVIIFAKQFPIFLGTSAKGNPLEMLADIPHQLTSLNPEVALIGVASLAVLIGIAVSKNPKAKKLPAALLAVAVAVPLGLLFDLEHTHTYTWGGHTFELSQKFLVNIPGNFLKALAFPDFSALLRPIAWKWVAMFALIGSLESTLSAKAVDLLDPRKRRSNLNQDLRAIGLANLFAALIGGLPMISEIVRSRANIDNGAQSRKSLFFHGLFLLVFLAFFPAAIHRIPLAALAALLVYTGYRLASPKEFMHMKAIGGEQLIVYVGTILAVLATDLLMGVLIGVGIELMTQLYLGVPLKNLFRSSVRIEQKDSHVEVSPEGAAVFAHWPWLGAKLRHAAKGNTVVKVNFAQARLVDHTVMSRVYELTEELRTYGVEFQIEGLEQHGKLSEHRLAARRLDA